MTCVYNSVQGLRGYKVLVLVATLCHSHEMNGGGVGQQAAGSAESG